jgi:hypothetical protein
MLAHADHSPRQFFEVLVEVGLSTDAIRWLARSLPPRQSVWWGALCVWHGYRVHCPDGAAAALEAATRWVHVPSDEHRRAARVASRECGITKPAGVLASAAFVSGGSLSHPGLPVVAPPNYLTGKLVAGAILLAAVQHEPLAYRDHYRQYLAIGRDVAASRNRWASPSCEIPSAALRVDVPSATTRPHFMSNRPTTEVVHSACGCAKENMT